MAFKGLRFAHGEIRNNSAGAVMKIVMAAIGIIPLLYGALYLLAFLDPYEQLNTVPVAVVNEDNGAVVNGSFRKVGDDVVDRLKNSDNGLGWQFVNADEAQEGLEEGRYYMTCTIPSDFTADIASADTDTPEHAQLDIEYNETQNMLASQIGGTVWKEVRTQVSDAVAEEYWDAVFNKVNDGANDLQTAADGAAELNDGLKDARSGSATITDNLVTLHDGSVALNDGLRQLVAGTLQLQDGSTTLANGAQTLHNGTNTLAGGSSTLAQGASKLQSGAAQLKNEGTSVLASGAGQLEQGTRALPNKKAVQAAHDGSDKLTQGIDNLRNAGSRLSDGTAALQSGLSSVSAGLGNADDTGSTSLYGGTNQLVAGLEQLKGDAASGTGLSYAAAGSHQLASQLSDTSTLDDGIAQLKQGTGQIESGVDQILAGTSQVEGALDETTGQLDQATEQMIGAKQSIGAAAAALQGIDMSTLTPKQQQAIGSALQNLGAASDGIGDENGGALRAAGTAKAYAAGAKDGLTGSGDASNPGVDGGLAGLKDGATQVSAGLDQLQASADESLGQASAAAAQIADGLDTAVAAIGSTGEQGQTLLYGAASLKSGIGQVKSGIGNASDTGSTTLFGGVNQLSAGIGSANDTSTNTLNGGLNNLKQGYTSFSAQMMPLVDKAPELRAAIEKIYGGAQQVDTNMASVVQGASQVSDGAGQVASGAAQLNDGMATAANGANQLASGASQLHSGSATAQDGSQQIADGSQKLADGSAKLTSGLRSAEDGSGELAQGLKDGVAGMRVTHATERAQVMNDPVQLNEEFYTDVKNYGTGFAPYFIALGLWVGSLMTSFVFRPLNKRLILSGGNPVMVAFANYLPFALMSAVQAAIMLAVLQFGLQLQIDNVGLYYAFGILTGLVFAAIMQMLTAAFGFPGKFVAIILLMLQLTSAAGTFPIEQTPAFFQTIHPFIPMTYVVRGMRQVMTGLDMGTALQCAGVLVAIGIACFAITALVARAKRIVTMADLHPILDLG